MRKTLVVCAAALAAQPGLICAAYAASVGGFDTLTGAAPVVVAHRGVPAYLPENTIGGNELSAQMGADWIETDVMMTADNVLVAMHDSSLDRTTNVEDVYAKRNGGYYVRDFTYAELQALTVTPTGDASSSYPGFDAMDPEPFRVPSFADMLDALNDYNEANGTNVGILTEGKYGFDAETNRAVVETLAAKGFDSSENSVLQSFDFGNVFDYMLMQDELDTDMGIAQLGVASLSGDDWTLNGMITLDVLSTYVDTVAVGAWSLSEAFIDAAHGFGLSVFAWTYRPDDLAEAYEQMETHIGWGLDGLITDNTDLAREVIDSLTPSVGASLPPAPVPVPAALPLLGAALGGLALLRRRRPTAA